jgi:hypothetical protein
MRLIGEFKTEKEATTFLLVLKREGIKSNFEPFENAELGTEEYRIWILEEDQVEWAFELFEKFKRQSG